MSNVKQPQSVYFLFKKIRRRKIKQYQNLKKRNQVLNLNKKQLNLKFKAAKFKV